jgi:hypothetical protein
MVLAGGPLAVACGGSPVAHLPAAVLLQRFVSRQALQRQFEQQRRSARLLQRQSRPATPAALSGTGTACSSAILCAFLGFLENRRLIDY